MAAAKIEISLSEIRRTSGISATNFTDYTVGITAKDDFVTANFEVRVFARQRSGRKGQHHTEIEVLERKAREDVLNFCKKITASQQPTLLT